MKAVIHKTSSPETRNSSGVNLFFQPKLRINQPNDAYEREADSVAEQVMRKSDLTPAFFSPKPVFIQRQEKKKEEEPEDKTGEVITGGLGTVASQAMEHEPFKLWLDANLLNYLKNTFWEQRSDGEKAMIVTHGILTAGLFGASFVDPNMRKTFNDVDLGAALSWIPYNPIGGFKYKLPDKISPNYQFNLELQGDDYLDLVRESHPGMPQLGFTLGLSSKYSKASGFGLTGGSFELKVGAGIINLKGFVNQPVSPYPVLIPPSEPGGSYSWLMEELPGIDEALWPKGTGVLVQVDVLRIPQLFSGSKKQESGSATEVRRKCKECDEEEEKPLHRKEKSENEIQSNASLENYVHDLNGSGQPLPDSSRNFFESRFGVDFSSVKIHHDSAAAHSAESVNALAYTAGNNIVFNQNQYSPETDSGRKLLAHELTHVVQQQPDTVKRKVIGMSTIEKDLSTGGKDRITNAEAHHVLEVLKLFVDLFPGDFGDTVQEMDRRGLVDKLFKNISADDQYLETEILQSIQNNRVFKVGTKEVVDSCRPDQRTALNEEVKEVKKWADAGISVMVDFDLRRIDETAGVRAAELLDRHFFHQSLFRKLSDTEQESLSRGITESFRRVREFSSSPSPMFCTSPFDRLCKTLAAAYVSSAFAANSAAMGCLLPTDPACKTAAAAGRPRIFFCPSFFLSKKPLSTQVFFHELFHASAGRDDTGYGHERIYKFLPPQEAVNNADSYSMLSYEALYGTKEAAKILTTPEDEFKNFTEDQKKDLRQWLAYAERLITNTLNTIGGLTFGEQNAGNAATNHFKAANSSDLKKAVENFKKIGTKTGSAIKFKFIAKEKGKLFKASSSEIKIYPDFFGLEAEDLKVKNLLLALIEHGSGLDVTMDEDNPAYPRQVLKDALKNAASYAAYAWKVSMTATKFQFATAPIRYAHDLVFRAENLNTQLLEEFFDERFKRDAASILFTMRENLNADLKVFLPSDRSEAESIWTAHKKKTEAMMKAIRKVHAWYFPFITDLSIKTILMKEPISESLSRLIDSRLSPEIMIDVTKMLEFRLGEIYKGSFALPDPWGALELLKSKYEKYVTDLPSYYPAFKTLQKMHKTFYDEIAKHKTKPKESDALWHEYEVRSLVSEFRMDLWLAESVLQTETFSYSPYNPKSPTAQGIESMVLEYKKKTDETFAMKKADTAIGKALTMFIKSQGLDPGFLTSAVFSADGIDTVVSVKGKKELQITTLPELTYISIKKLEAGKDKTLTCFYDVSGARGKYVVGGESCGVF